MPRPEYSTFPYRVEYPDSGDRARSCKTLEDSLWESRSVHHRWREDNEYGEARSFIYPNRDRAVITNRNTGYRWIVRRGESKIEFQTPEMFEDLVGDELIHLALTVQEAEALARLATSGGSGDKRTRVLGLQALDQIGYLCRSVRGRVASADEFFGWARQIDIERRSQPVEEAPETSGETTGAGDGPQPIAAPQVVSLKQAAKIIGKAPSTVYKWYREGKFPPAVDVSQLSPYRVRVPVVVALDRLDAWLAGEPMRPMFEQVFEGVGLREPPWACLRTRKGASRADIDYWVDKRVLTKARDTDGLRIYGRDLDASKQYEIRPL